MCVFVCVHTLSTEVPHSVRQRSMCVFLLRLKVKKKLFCAAWEEMQGYFQFTLTKSVAFFKH